MRAAAPAVWHWDAEHGLFLVSKGFRALYGLGRAQRFGVEAFIESADLGDRSLWRQLLHGGNDPSPAQRTIVYRFQRADTGEFRWARADLDVGQSAAGLASITATLADVTEQRQSALALVESEERLQLAIEAGRMAVWEVDLDSGRLTNSAQLNLLLGFPVDARPTVADVRALYAPGELERLEREGATYERVRDNAVGGADAVRRDWQVAVARDRTQVQAEFTLISPNGTPKQLILRAQHAPPVGGIGQRLTGILVDITDRKRAEERLGMVARELQHRVKNSLMVVRALAAQSFREGRDVAASLEAFNGRIGALAAATDAMLESSFEAVSLRRLVERIVLPYRSSDADPFRIEGPEIELSAKLGTALGMAFHELCTNTLKYGALSVPGGTVSIAWQLTDATLLDLEWRESGGPQVRAPVRPGFGSRLLQTVIPDGSIAVEYASSGVICRMRCVLETGQAATSTGG